MPWPTRHSPPYAVRYASIILAESDSKKKKVEAGEKLKSVEVWPGPKYILSGLGCKPVANVFWSLNRNGPKANKFKGSGFMVGLVANDEEEEGPIVIVAGDVQGAEV